ncbi:MAG: 30S ribosomal protein S3 [Chloroflexi bacterium]|nr:30S ribosomal protein S3 [Chloroflexota bacterium]
MGHKTHPIGFRLGIIKDWHARWFAARKTDYREMVYEDQRLRQAVMGKYQGAGISHLEIERSAGEVTVAIFTSRPGIIIGRQGQRVEELRQSLEALTKGRVRVNVQEVRQPELDAALVGRSIADQLERRVSHRRAMVQTASRTMQAGALGIRIICRGRLGGAEIARREKMMVGRVPLHTIRADIDFAVVEALTVMGRIGVKVWIYKGDIRPVGKEPEVPEEEMAPIQVKVTPEAGEEVASAATETS